MSIGSAYLSTLARGFGQFAGDKETRGLLNFGGDLLDTIGAQNNLASAQAMDARNLALQQQYLNLMAQQGAKQDAWDTAMRNRILGQTTELGDTLRSTYEALGPRTPIDEANLVARYQQLKDIAYGDLDRAIDRAASKSFSANIARGMGDSGLNRDSYYDVVERFAPMYQKADATAYGTAYDQALARQKLVDDSRDQIFNEMKTVLGSQIDAEGRLYSPSSNPYSAYGTGLSNSLSTSGDAVTSASTAAGTAFGNLTERLGSTLGQYAGTYEPPKYEEVKRDGETLYRRVNS